MPWPVHPNGLLGASGDNDTYQVSRSLRFNSADSAYLNRTPASITNQKTYTFNFWFKRSELGSQQEMFSTLFASTSLRYAYIGFSTSDTLEVFTGIYSLGASTTTSYSYVTTQVFRDTSAWYMITVAIDTTNATASDRVKIYVNGTQVTSFSTATQPALNQNGYWNSTQFHGIGTFNASISFFDGYLAEVNFIDGLQLTPSSFSETDSFTGRLKAKAYSGSYGTNGYYLKFADNSAATAATIGKDSSVNANNWTPNAISVTAGPGNDSLVDSPTNYGLDSYNTTVDNARGNYNTFNGLSRVTTAALTNGNLNAGASGIAIGSIGMTSGKWYWEITSTGGATAVGMYSASATSTRSVAIGVTEGFRFDALAGTFDYTTNGSTFTSIATGLTSTPYFIYVSTAAATTASLNSGQRLFSYNMPAGYKTLCSTNLPTPTIKKPSSYFDAVTFTATGADQAITGLDFSPNFVWIKNRANWAGNRHTIYDTTRGAVQRLDSSTTEDEAADNDLSSFDANGFSGNYSGTTYVAWNWKEAAISRMDIVDYTGNGANRTIAHNLGVAPKMLVVKARTTAGADQGWPVWHSSIANTTYVQLNSTAATAAGTNYWNSTSPTSSVFSVGTNAAVNTSADTYIAYAFAEVEGFSKFGSYTGNANASGPFVYCGFRPSFILIKSSTAVDAWLIYDNERNTFNVASSNLVPNTNAAEATISGIDFVSNGFKLRTITTTPNAAQTYIFAAFAESPFKYARAR